jgi:hypothetical protein
MRLPALVAAMLGLAAVAMMTLVVAVVELAGQLPAAAAGPRCIDQQRTAMAHSTEEVAMP